MTNITCKVQNGRLLLFFPYDQEVIAKLQTLPFARWDKPYKAWSIPLTAVAYRLMVEVLGVGCPEIEEWLKKSRKTVDLGAWEFKTIPLPHQVEGIKFLLKQFNVEVV